MRLEVGRATDAPFSVPEDPRLSRRHFALIRQKDICGIWDLDSANGTFVDGDRVQTADAIFPVHAGQRIEAGDSVFSIVDDRVPAEETHCETSAALGGPVISGRKGGKADGFSAPMLRLTNETPFPAATMFWERPRGFTKLSVIVKATFLIVENEEVRIAPRQGSLLRTDRPTEDRRQSHLRFESDMVPFKPRTDIFVIGHAHAPAHIPVERLIARLEVGTLRHSVAVYGDRHWLFDPAAGITHPVMTRPRPFTMMPLGYERSFGGLDKGASRYCARNLAGTGFIGKCSRESIHGVRLPNLERVDQPIRSWDDHPLPVGFGVYGRGWMPRLEYGNRLASELSSDGMADTPDDTNLLFFNGADPELQMPGYLRGDESIRLVNLSDVSDLRFSLRRSEVRVSVSRRLANESRVGETWEVVPNLDTLVIVPDERLVQAVFRAVIDVSAYAEQDSCEIAILAR